MSLTGEIHFHAPGLRAYRTSEYAGQDRSRFVSISVTGRTCALGCEHCGTQLLRGMVPLPRRADGGLFEVCAWLKRQGTRGVLISGGCDGRGRVPLLPHIPGLVRVGRELGLSVLVHTGVVDARTAQALGGAGVSGVLLDIIGADETIREVYHLDLSTADYEQALLNLEANRLPALPHIVLGLHFGRLLGEYAALDMVARHPPKALVLVVLMPLSGTPMADVAPPPAAEIGDFFRRARACLPETPILLGCARPPGPLRAELDHLAIDAGLDGIAYPADGAAAYARSRGRTPVFHDSCCGLCGE